MQEVHEGRDTWTNLWDYVEISGINEIWLHNKK